MTKLKGALIGSGNIATRGHLPAYKEDPLLRDSIEIVAVMDVVDSAREAVQQLLPGSRFYTDIDELLDAEKIDFVDICTPPHTHAHYIRTCAERGIHIICEKPLTESNETAKEIAAALEGTKIVFVPCHQYKYSPLWKSIHELIESGELGRVTLAQFNVFRLQADTGTKSWNPAWRTDRKKSGGGILVDTGAHYFYLIQYFFGLPANLTSMLRTLKHADYGVEDTAVVILDYEDKLVQINLTWAANQRANSVVIAGTEGGITYDGTKLLLTKGDATREIPMPNVSDKNQYVGWYAALFKEFYRRVDEKNYSRDLFDEAMNVMDLLHKSYHMTGIEGRN
ncbi:MAG TPA: Gfo/Idh/MocA family oxidoreductase [Bacteroidota bacterium]|nr:Gfo/Idh/MocA family oxidoreductase [Bacteroidota bacterium]